MITGTEGSKLTANYPFAMATADANTLPGGTDRRRNR